MNKYIIITPVKNEETYIEKTIRSVLNQTKRPYKWIIVNDGSTDNTADIVKKYLSENDWITLVNRKSDPVRKRGKGVVDTFYVGFEKIKDEMYDFIVKLDGDIILPHDFFEIILKRFEQDPKLGLAGGQELVQLNNQWINAKGAKGATYGTAKVYRKSCFTDIGGLVPHMGWDGIDQIMADMKGWTTAVFYDLKYYHLRIMGKETGLLKSAYEEGLCCYYMGYLPLFFVIRAVKMMKEPPYIMGGLAMIYAFVKSVIFKKERINNKDFIKYLRKNQCQRIAKRSNKYV